MANRTSAAAVRLIIETDVTIALDSFIEVANDMVTDVCTDSGYTATKLELIERWLSAHFYAVRDMRVANEKAKGVSQSFQYKVDLILNVTVYGQMAQTIDVKGNLAALSNRIKKGKASGVNINWMGTSYDEDTEDD